MSQQIAGTFIQKVQADDALRADVIALGQDIDGLVALGAQHGFSFTADELRAAVQTGGYAGDGELNEDQLAAVAGGNNQATTQATSWTGCASNQGGCIITTVTADGFCIGA